MSYKFSLFFYDLTLENVGKKFPTFLYFRKLRKNARNCWKTLREKTKNAKINLKTKKIAFGCYLPKFSEDLSTKCNIQKLWENWIFWAKKCKKKSTRLRINRDFSMLIMSLQIRLYFNRARCSSLPFWIIFECENATTTPKPFWKIQIEIWKCKKKVETPLVPKEMQKKNRKGQKKINQDN